jgi:hypothetical protein
MAFQPKRNSPTSSTLRGLGKSEARFAIVWIIAAIVKRYTDIPAYRVDTHQQPGWHGLDLLQSRARNHENLGARRSRCDDAARGKDRLGERCRSQKYHSNDEVHFRWRVPPTPDAPAGYSGLLLRVSFMAC